MTKDILEARMKELLNLINKSAENFQILKAQVENATNNHNTLVGRFEEAKALYEKFDSPESEKVIETHVAE
jgi:hypothetical protein